MRRVPTKILLGAGLLVALLLAGVVSFYASGSPDGLERVAEDKGFLDSAEEHPAADGPLADYRAKGVDDDRLAGGVAGVTGALVVLVVVGGLTYVVRRRAPEHSDRG
jgi:cobalt/nickel transport protein